MSDTTFNTIRDDSQVPVTPPLVSITLITATNIAFSTPLLAQSINSDPTISGSVFTVTSVSGATVGTVLITVNKTRSFEVYLGTSDIVSTTAVATKIYAVLNALGVYLVFIAGSTVSIGNHYHYVMMDSVNISPLPYYEAVGGQNVKVSPRDDLIHDTNTSVQEAKEALVIANQADVPSAQEPYTWYHSALRTEFFKALSDMLTVSLQDLINYASYLRNQTNVDFYTGDNDDYLDKVTDILQSLDVDPSLQFLSMVNAENAGITSYEATNRYLRNVVKNVGLLRKWAGSGIGYSLPFKLINRLGATHIGVLYPPTTALTSNTNRTLRLLKGPKLAVELPTYGNYPNSVHLEGLASVNDYGTPLISWDSGLSWDQGSAPVPTYYPGNINVTMGQFSVVAVGSTYPTTGILNQFKITVSSVAGANAGKFVFLKKTINVNSSDVATISTFIAKVVSSTPYSGWSVAYNGNDIYVTSTGAGVIAYDDHVQINYSGLSLMEEVSLDRVLYHKNSLGTRESLMDIGMLETVRSFLKKVKRAQDNVFVGAQISLVNSKDGRFNSLQTTSSNTLYYQDFLSGAGGWVAMGSSSASVANGIMSWTHSGASSFLQYNHQMISSIGNYLRMRVRIRPAYGTPNNTTVTYNNGVQDHTTTMTVDGTWNNISFLMLSNSNILNSNNGALYVGTFANASAYTLEIDWIELDTVNYVSPASDAPAYSHPNIKAKTQVFQYRPGTSQTGWTNMAGVRYIKLGTGGYRDSTVDNTVFVPATGTPNDPAYMILSDLKNPVFTSPVDTLEKGSTSGFDYLSTTTAPLTIADTTISTSLLLSNSRNSSGFIFPSLIPLVNKGISPGSVSIGVNINYTSAQPNLYHRMRVYEKKNTLANVYDPYWAYEEADAFGLYNIMATQAIPVGYTTDVGYSADALGYIPTAQKQMILPYDLVQSDQYYFMNVNRVMNLNLDSSTNVTTSDMVVTGVNLSSNSVTVASGTINTPSGSNNISSNFYTLTSSANGVQVTDVLSIFNNLSSITASMAIRPTNFSGTATLMDLKYWKLTYSNTASVITFTITCTATGNGSWTYTTPFVTNTWMCVGFTVNPNSKSPNFYLNGMLKAPATATPYTGTITFSSVGIAKFCQTYAGDVAEMVVYSKDFKAHEMQKLHTVTLVRKNPLLNSFGQPVQVWIDRDAGYVICRLQKNIYGIYGDLSATVNTYDSYGATTTLNYKTGFSDNLLGITEFGAFDSDDALVAYATFPPIIYDQTSNHLSINLLVQQ